MMWNDGSWGAGSWILMSLMMVLFWGGLAVLVVWLIRGRGASSTGEQASALRRADEVLAERFARGEIDEAEYTRRRVLMQTTATRS